MTQLRLLSSLDALPAMDWDGLHDNSNPFVTHAFLHGLECHGCLRENWGWVPRHAALFDGAELIAAAPGYLKYNSHGEFIFDHAWANAYSRNGQAYYPKWLLAVPYSPVTGPRILARDAIAQRTLIEAMREETQRAKLPGDFNELRADFVPFLYQRFL